MKKIDLNYDDKSVVDYIEQIASDPLLKNCKVNLNNVNDYALVLEHKKNCANCLSLENCPNPQQGYYAYMDDEHLVMKACEKKEEFKKKNDKKELIRTLFISKAILNASLDEFYVDTPIRQKILEYITNFIAADTYQKGLYIYGDYATGKTYILGCIANALALKNIASLIIYFPDLVVDLKAAIGTPRLEELINYLKSVDVLLLDDFGSENLTPWLRDEVLGPVLNYRLMEQKPLFISSNLNSGDELLNHLCLSKSKEEEIKAKRIVSRLMGLVKTIELDNKQYSR